MFRDVKKQIKGVATLLFRGKDSISTTTVYTFSRMGKPNKVHKVLIDPNEEKIECECSMWNSEGIPCSHIFCAMKYEGLEEIPPVLFCEDGARKQRIVDRPRLIVKMALKAVCFDMVPFVGQ